MTRVAAALAVAAGVWTMALTRAAQQPPPTIWDDAALAEWATPIAGLNVRPAHYSAAEYYAAPVENLRTYPVYEPDREPAGYWEWLHKQKPEPLVDATKIRTRDDWIAAGERAFRDLDSVLVRTNEPELIAKARDPGTYDNAFTLPDGSVLGVRWVVTDITPCARAARSGWRGRGSPFHVGRGPQYRPTFR
jgi:hypothetical protein